ncbi:MAG: S1 RNA-binding domain-containing protein [Anaerolineales bacterium]|nr:S1 RNA-binding domain-containing protein [Anaerolineales bacterium]
MEKETKTPEPEQENQVPEEEKAVDQPGWFQDFVDHYDIDKPQQGDMLKGTILDIQDSSIVLDVGFKRDAIIPGQDLERVDSDIRDNLSIGDEIFVSVIRTPMGDDDLLVSLQRGLTYKTWIKADELAQSNEQIELEVVDQNRGGLLVAYDNLRGFIPNSHIPAIRRGTSTQRAGEIKSEMIGKTLPLKVIEVDQKERRLVFSARVVQKGQRLKRLNEIEIGTVLKSRVVNVVDFGVFVDLGGVDGLVHKSEIDWERIPHPSKMFKLGDEIEVKIIGIDKEKERVSLSRKILLPNPWLKNLEKFQVGDLVEGLVVSVLDFGAFVELAEGFQGLVHISEIGYANTEDPKAVVKKGDPVLVKIMSIDPERERISLSMRRVPISEQMEWIMNLEDAVEGILLDRDDDLLDEESEQEETKPVDPPDEIEGAEEEVESDEDPTEEREEHDTSEEEELSLEESEDPE